MNKNLLNERDLEKVSGGKNNMVIKEENIMEKNNHLVKGMNVTYKCPNCGNEYIDTYQGCYMTQKGYPATTCPQCHNSYWGGEKLEKSK